MTRRILPSRDWDRLAGTALGPVWNTLDPETVRVMVVEDEDGEIIGCWSLMPFMHAEGFWIREDHRTKGAVLRKLWHEMTDATAELGLASVLTNAADADVASLLEKRGATTMPGLTYVLPTAHPADKHLGRAFHDKLFAVLPESAEHPEDAQHDAAVGRAIRIGLLEADPMRAERQYNAWAIGHGYAPISFVNQEPDGSMVVDIVEAVIRMGPDQSITVLESRLEAPCQP